MSTSDKHQLNTSKGVLPITGTAIPQFEFEGPLENVELPICDAFVDLYFALGKIADEGLRSQAALMQSLAILCSFSPRYEDSIVPYGPQIQLGNGRRSFVPDDLSHEDIEVVTHLFNKSKNPALRARLGDILWIRKRDHAAAITIIDDYLSIANKLLSPENWIHACPLFRRALQVARALGRKNSPWLKTEQATLLALDDPRCADESYYASHMFHIIIDMNIGDSVTLALKAQALALKENHLKNPQLERAYRVFEVALWRRSKNHENAAAAQLAEATTYVTESEANVNGPVPSYFAASASLAQGIEALRQAHADPTIISQLRQLLVQYQRKARKEFKTIQTPGIDLTEPSIAAAKFVTASTLDESLRKLAFGYDLTNVQEVRAEVLKLAEQHPFSHLFNTEIVDDQGRVIERLDGLLLLSGAELEEKIIPHLFRHAVFDWMSRARMFVEPARQKIWDDHRPSPSDFECYVINNPFIPMGHEGIFLHGLYRGLAGDMLLAAHLLAPQIENSIRHVLELKGVDISSLSSDLTQEAKTFGGLILLPQMEEIFGKDMCFELRGHLIELSGFNFRNRVAHGLVTERECYSEASMSVWWLCLRLCFLGLLAMEEGIKGQTSDSDADGGEV